jgi:hypothetical protein
MQSMKQSVKYEKKTLGSKQNGFNDIMNEEKIPPVKRVVLQ